MRALPIAFLLIVGCSQPATVNNLSEADSEPMTSSPRFVRAVLTCQLNGSPIGVSACFMESHSTVGGSLKVRSDGSVKQYTDYDLATENGPTMEIPLKAPFEIVAQANSSDGIVLGLSIREDGKTIYRDETNHLGTVSADSDTL